MHDLICEMCRGKNVTCAADVDPNNNIFKGSKEFSLVVAYHGIEGKDKRPEGAYCHQCDKPTNLIPEGGE